MASKRLICRGHFSNFAAGEFELYIYQGSNRIHIPVWKSRIIIEAKVQICKFPGGSCLFDFTFPGGGATLLVSFC